MRRVLFAAAAVALLRFHAGLAQEANATQMEAISEIFRCMAPGLPQDWASAHRIVDLERRGWTTARLVFEHDGDCRLNYDFPAK